MITLSSLLMVENRDSSSLDEGSLIFPLVLMVFWFTYSGRSDRMKEFLSYFEAMSGIMSSGRVLIMSWSLDSYLDLGCSTFSIIINTTKRMQIK